MIEAALMRAWHRRGGLAVAMLPLAGLFALITLLRRTLFRAGILSSVRLPVPVIMVGNITVGGTGKTPLSIYLLEQLRHAGFHPGVVSRGYGRENSALVEVDATSATAHVGDEPLLISRRTSVPVMVGSNRVAAAQALLQRHPELDLIVSDDGLQHYRLQRDFEIAVLDRRGLMNRWLLPAGPLREPVSRLGSVDAIVINGGNCPSVLNEHELPHQLPQFAMELVSGDLYRLDDPAQIVPATHFAAGPVHALAGIGNPQRFFDQLTGMGLDVIAHPFPDHHDYVACDVPDDGIPVLITEKDAVKLGELAKRGVLGARAIWVLPVHAVVCSDNPAETLVTRILEKLRGPSPA